MCRSAAWQASKQRGAAGCTATAVLTPSRRTQTPTTAPCNAGLRSLQGRKELETLVKSVKQVRRGMERTRQLLNGVAKSCQCV